uniref:Beta sliding clamp n=1 Tax=candidate division WOR-3 bacterium TaxID=2052148 RepID=A0A7C4Y5J8_UNCW3
MEEFMKFTVNSREFLEVINPVLDTLPSHATFPVLSNFLIVTEKDKIIVFGTDLDNSIKVSYPAKVEEYGGCAISGKLIKNLLKEINDDISFEKKESKVVIKYKKGSFSLGLVEREEYPEIISKLPEHFIELNMKDIKESIEKTIFCLSSEQTRKIYMGLYWEYKEGILSMVGTDGYRLGVFSNKIELNIDEFGVIIPPKILYQVLSLGKDKIKFGLEKNKVFFICENYILTSRLIEEEFPEYKKAIPYDNKNILKVEKEEILSVLRRVSVLAADKPKTVYFYFDKDIKVEVDSEFGSGSEVLSGEYEGEKLKIALSSNNLIEFIRRIDNNIVEIYFGDSERPIMVKDPACEKILYITTPVLMRE